MKKVKKVALYLPYRREDGEKKKGFLSREEVDRVESILKNQPGIELVANIDPNRIEVVDNHYWYDNTDLAMLDFFFWYARDMKKFLPVFTGLSELVPMLKNPRVFKIVADKFYSHTILKKHGLPVAEFALVPYDNHDLMKKLLNQWKVLLVKPRWGSFGRGIIKVDDFDTLRDIAGLLMTEHGQEKIFVEKYYDNDQDQWISTTIIGGKVVYGYRKEAEKVAGWKVYDLHKKGGGAYYVDPAPVRELAEKAAAVLDRSIVGFDFIKAEQGYKLVDENNMPGFYDEAFNEAGADVAKLVAEMVIANLESE